MTVFSSVPPFAAIQHLGGCVKVDSSPALDSIYPLAIVEVSLGRLEYASTIFLSVEELSLVDVLVGNILETFTMLLAFCRLPAFPAPHVELP